MSTGRSIISQTRSSADVVPKQRRASLFAGCSVLTLMLAAASTVVAFTADTPITPGASPEAQALLTYFSDIYGKKIISGQQAGWRRKNGLGFEMGYITNNTGKLPALLALDLSPYTDKSPRRDTNHALARQAIQWFNEHHGIVMFCWHWRPPMNEPSVYIKDTTFDISRAVMEGTPEHDAIVRDLDMIADELAVLRDAHVPVLWRPLHEANGRWFWWGAHGPEPFKKLWRMMFERFTVQHHLDNLIWVFSPGAETDLADWYPGDEYVDIIGQDHYPMDGNHGAAKNVFDELTKLTRGKKLIALGENGPIPDPAQLVREKAGWLFFATWSGDILTGKNSPEQLRAYFNNPYVLNLGDLPDLRHYPFQRVGPAMKLGFVAAPGGVAVGGFRRLPVNVAVQDKDGRTVRMGKSTVTLALENNHGGGVLAGTLTATTINGIATFPDLQINQAGKNYRLIARADGLRSAVSQVFEVGPGVGIVREWWTDLTNVDLTTLGQLAERPAGREILDEDFEAPVNLATNFGARYQGFLIPPMTGAYKFWIANESVSELWLSRDDSPADKIKIAAVTGSTPYSKWPHTHEAESGSVNLEAGKRYYLEVLQRQASGSTQLAVHWRLPDGVEEHPIPGWRLLPLDEAFFKPSASSTTTAQAQ
ncbi:MAG: glycosyl hydrolase [Verrucomicrobiota bacterium]|jgi:mannan endo-1,4-beta-mannosidase